MFSVAQAVHLKIEIRAPGGWSSSVVDLVDTDLLASNPVAISPRAILRVHVTNYANPAKPRISEWRSSNNVPLRPAASSSQVVVLVLVLVVVFVVFILVVRGGGCG